LYQGDNNILLRSTDSTGAAINLMSFYAHNSAPIININTSLAVSNTITSTGVSGTFGGVNLYLNGRSFDNTGGVYFRSNSGVTNYGFLNSTPTRIELNSVSGALYLVTSGAQPFVVSPNNSEAMRITATGNVGIGTASPGSPLDVVGNINSSGTISAAAMTSNSKAVVTTGPRFNAWVTTSFGLTTNVQAVLLFKSITFDTTGAVNTSTGAIVPGVAGYYSVSVTAQFVSSGGVLNTTLVVIKQNGVQKANSYISGGTGPYSNFSHTATTILNLSASDPITVEVYTLGTGTLSISGGNAYTSWIACHFISAT
jgi:hypothetical protein